MKVSERFIQANVFLVTFLILGPIAYQLTLVERAPLPYDVVDQFESQRKEMFALSQHTVRLHFLRNLEVPSDCGEQAPSLVAKDIRHETHPVVQQHEYRVSQWESWKRDSHMFDEGLGKYATNRQGTFDIFFIAVTSADAVANSVTMGQHRHAWSTFPTAKCGDREWLTNQVNLILDRVSPRLRHPGQTLPAGISVVYPSYHVSLSLLVAEPDERPGLRAQWMNGRYNFSKGRVDDNKISRFFQAMKSVATFTVEPQVMYFNKLASPMRPLPGTHQVNATYVRPRDLRRFIGLNDNINFGSGLRGHLEKLVQFAAFVPAIKHTPVVISPTRKYALAKEDGVLPETGFIIPRWGGVVVLNMADPLATTFTGAEFGQFESMFVAHARGIFRLDEPLNFPEKTSAGNAHLTVLMPTKQCVAEWEVDALILDRLHDHINITHAKINMVLEIAKKLHNIIIRAEIGVAIDRAVESIDKSLRHLRTFAKENVQDGSHIELALRELREGYLAAEEANQDPSMVTEEFFPTEHLVAVYSPLLLPLVLPVIFGLWEAYSRQWRRYKGEEVSDSDAESDPDSDEEREKAESRKAIDKLLDEYEEEERLQWEMERREHWIYTLLRIIS